MTWKCLLGAELTPEAPPDPSGRPRREPLPVPKAWGCGFELRMWPPLACRLQDRLRRPETKPTRPMSPMSPPGLAPRWGWLKADRAAALSREQREEEARRK